MAMTYLLVLNELYDIYSNSLIGHTYFNPNIIGDEKPGFELGFDHWGTICPLG